MNKSTMEAARLSFDVNRKERLLAISNKDVFGKGNFGHKCQEGRDEFSYLRTMIKVEIDNKLMEQHMVKKINFKRLRKATQEAIKGNSAENTLSA